MQMETKRILISDKIDFEIKAINIQRRTLHNHQESSKEEIGAPQYIKANANNYKRGSKTVTQ